MELLKNDFLELYEKHFRFLEDYGFKTISNKEDSLGKFLFSKNRTTAIEISLEPMEGGVFVRLIQLINGKVPEYPMSLDSKTAEYSVDLDWYLRYKSLTPINRPSMDDIVKLNILEKVLSKYARVIEKHCKNILEGDFGEFKDILQYIKKMNMK